MPVMKFYVYSISGGWGAKPRLGCLRKDFKKNLSPVMKFENNFISSTENKTSTSQDEGSRTYKGNNDKNKNFFN